MNFAKNIYDLKGKTILDMKMGQFSNEAVFVTTDGTFMVVEYEFKEEDDSFERIGGNFFQKFRAERYLLDNPGTREWLQRLNVLTTEEAEHYEDTIKERREKARIEREEKSLIAEKEKLETINQKISNFGKRSDFRGGTYMLVTNILLGIIIVALFIILERLNDIFYSGTEEHTISMTPMTQEQIKELFGNITDEEE